jgi:multidrug efflux pump subunit AcrA (membrane-fusion protein)
LRLVNTACAAGDAHTLVVVDGAIAAPPHPLELDQALGEAPPPPPAGRRRPAPAIAVLRAIVVALVVGVYLYQLGAPSASRFTLSGTIEATEVRVGAEIGGQVKQVYVDEGTPVNTNDRLLSLYSNTIDANDVPKSPVDGVVLERLVEPGELVSEGSTLIVIADLNALTLKVYVPEADTHR